MGDTYKAICSCGYETKLNLGAGVNGCNINFIKRLLQKQDTDKFIQAYEKEQVKTFIIENVAYLCDNCKNIGSVFQFTYQLKSGQEVKVRGKCSKCGSPVQPVFIDKLLCPECGKKLTKELEGHWD